MFMDRSTVGLRLPKLPIMITAFRAIVLGRQPQTFIPAMLEERKVLM
jgi:hypothetical protein